MLHKGTFIQAVGRGLRKVGHQVVLENTPSVRGMVKKVEYMIRVEEV